MNVVVSPELVYIEKLRVNPASQDIQGLTRDLISELREYFAIPATTSDAQVLEICQQSPEKLIQEWRDKKIDSDDANSILRFYSETKSYCYELTALDLSASPARKRQLSEFVDILKQFGKKRGLDFGSGIGSTGIYLLGSGFECEFADVSSTNLDFIQLRLKNRKLKSKTHLLPQVQIPHASFDFVLAMDVLEHLADPIAKIAELRTYLSRGGILIYNIIAGGHDGDPLHIMHDPDLIRKQIRGLGFKKVGSIGEFKIYQRVDRPAVFNMLLKILDLVFWNVRSAIKGK